MKKTFRLLTAIASLTALTGSAFAALPGGYAGLGLGASNLDTQKTYIYSDQVAGSNSSQSRKIGGLGGRIFAGYNFNQYVGLEAGLARYAPSSYDSTINGLATNKIDIKQYAFDVVGKGYLPIAESGFNVYALGGLALVNTTTSYDYKFSGVPARAVDAEYKSSKIRPIVGIGASYDIPDTKLTANLEFTHIHGDGKIDIQKIGATVPTDVNKNLLKGTPSANLVSLNLAYNFA